MCIVRGVCVSVCVCVCIVPRGWAPVCTSELKGCLQSVHVALYHIFLLIPPPDSNITVPCCFSFQHASSGHGPSPSSPTIPQCLSGEHSVSTATMFSTISVYHSIVCELHSLTRKGSLCIRFEYEPSPFFNSRSSGHLVLLSQVSCVLLCVALTT